MVAAEVAVQTDYFDLPIDFPNHAFHADLLDVEDCRFLLRSLGEYFDLSIQGGSKKPSEYLHECFFRKRGLFYCNLCSARSRPTLSIQGGAS